MLLQNGRILYLVMSKLFNADCIQCCCVVLCGMLNQYIGSEQKIHKHEWPKHEFAPIGKYNVHFNHKKCFVCNASPSSLGDLVRHLICGKHIKKMIDEMDIDSEQKMTIQEHIFHIKNMVGQQLPAINTKGKVTNEQAQAVLDILVNNPSRCNVDLTMLIESNLKQQSIDPIPAAQPILRKTTINDDDRQHSTHQSISTASQQNQNAANHGNYQFQLIGEYGTDFNRKECFVCGTRLQSESDLLGFVRHFFGGKHSMNMIDKMNVDYNCKLVLKKIYLIYWISLAARAK